VIRTCFETPIGVVCIDLRLNFHLHRRPELRNLIDDLKAILVDYLFIRTFERLFVDRNFITT
jgi:hypothetical protein